MKKLLLILLCLPLLFSSCEEEDNSPTNTGNNLSTASGNFLEKHNGSVWNYSSGINPFMFNTIGFHNSTYFFINKGPDDCKQYKFGSNINSLGEEFIITTTQHNHYGAFKMVEKFNGSSSETQFELYNNSMKVTVIDGITSVSYFDKSLDTNLSCN